MPAMNHYVVTQTRSITVSAEDVVSAVEMANTTFNQASTDSKINFAAGRVGVSQVVSMTVDKENY